MTHGEIHDVDVPVQWVFLKQIQLLIIELIVLVLQPLVLTEWLRRFPPLNPVSQVLTLLLRHECLVQLALSLLLVVTGGYGVLVLVVG